MEALSKLFPAGCGAVNTKGGGGEEIEFDQPQGAGGFDVNPLAEEDQADPAAAPAAADDEEDKEL